MWSVVFVCVLLLGLTSGETNDFRQETPKNNQSINEVSNGTSAELIKIKEDQLNKTSSDINDIFGIQESITEIGSYNHSQRSIDYNKYKLNEESKPNVNLLDLQTKLDSDMKSSSKIDLFKFNTENSLNNQMIPTNSQKLNIPINQELRNDGTLDIPPDNPNAKSVSIDEVGDSSTPLYNMNEPKIGELTQTEKKKMPEFFRDKVIPLVEIPDMGKIHGSFSKSYLNNRTIYSFRGIPFAQPPNGPRRFQSPVSAKPWSGTLDGTKQGRMCPQEGSFNSEDQGDPEDCLHLNVFTPSLESDTSLAVIVYLHEGDFVRGSSADVRSERMLDEDVVLVVPQYRLGPLGFLCLHTNGIPGNAGLLDVMGALRWVRDHVAVFGGDPTRVTVFGHDAGAVLASLLLISPPALGLFHGVVSESGNFLSRPWFEPNPVSHALKMAEIAGNSDKKQAEKFLLNAPPQVLVNSSLIYLEENIRSGGDGRRGLCPVVQRVGRVLALPAPPPLLLEHGHVAPVPIIVGTSKHDGALYYHRYHNKYLKYTGLIHDKDFLKNDLIKYIFYVSGLDTSDAQMTSAIEEMYVPDTKSGDFHKMLPGIIDLYGQFWSKVSSHLLAETFSQYNSSYYYSFSYSPDSTNKAVVPHCSDKKYLFSVEPFPKLEEEQDVSTKMIKLFTNFAKYGEPTPVKNPVPDVPTWQKYVPSAPSYPYLQMSGKFTIESDISSEFDVAHRENLDVERYFEL